MRRNASTKSSSELGRLRNSQINFFKINRLAEQPLTYGKGMFVTVSVRRSLSKHSWSQESFVGKTSPVGSPKTTFISSKINLFWTARKLLLAENLDMFSSTLTTIITA